MGAKASKGIPVLATNPILTRVLQNLDKLLDKKLNYKPAKVYNKAGFFCVIFYWRPSIESKFKRYKKTFELNRIPDLKERAKAAQIVANAVNEALANGYNPERENYNVEVPNFNIKLNEAINLAWNDRQQSIDKSRIYLLP